MIRTKSKTEQQIKEEQRIKSEIRIREAIYKDKELIPRKDWDEEIADPHILIGSLPEPGSIDDDYDTPVEELRLRGEQQRAEKNLMLEDYLSQFANEFPIDIFPAPIREHIRDAEKCLNFPQEYYAAGILSAVAGAIRNNFRIMFKDKLLTTAMLYLVIVGRSSINKSTPLERALKPLFDKEVEFERQYRKNYADFKTLKNEGIDNNAEPICRRCVVNDTTMEALKEILAANPQGLTLYYDEFMSFLNSMNKYRSGDDMQTWLSIWSAKMMRVDRKKQMGVLLKQPFVNCVGTIQGDVLTKFIASLKDMNGFIDRILFATTTTPPKREWNNLILNDELEKQYHKILKNITDAETAYDAEGEINSRTLHFSSGAFTKIMQWQNENTERCRNMNDQQMIGIYNKLELYALRFTLILTVLDYAYKNPSVLINDKLKIIITERHVNDAIRLTEYFRNSANRIMSFVSQKTTTKHYNPRFTKFYEKLPSVFNTDYAMKIGMLLGLSPKSVYNYLKHDWIKKIGRAEYEKCYEQK
jgi:Protein of unknown function (DUF3987)